jgi:hypothetical protein
MEKRTEKATLEPTGSDKKIDLSKFNELCLAYGKAKDDFETFRLNCHLLAIDLVKEFKSYFKIPESQFSLYALSVDNKFEIVPPSLINALTLSPKSYWQFGIGLTVCIAPETLPQELILIHVLLRRDSDNKYFVKYGNDDKEFEVIKGNLKSFHKFFDFLHEVIVTAYNDQLQNFIDLNTSRKLGYSS